MLPRGRSTLHDGTLPDAVAATPARRARVQPKTPRALGRHFFGTEAAAAKLDSTPEALRARIRRHARLEDGDVVARLGMGVVARKFGATWRIYFTNYDEAADGT